MKRSVRQARGIHGHAVVPGDKSIAHRAAILSAIAEGTSRLVHYPLSEDPQSTLQCIAALGVEVVREEDFIEVRGVGKHGLRQPSGPLDCGNSGTTMRLLSGLLAGQAFPSELIGDESLSARPMDRVATPLVQMGANIRLEDRHAPISISPAADGLKGIAYRLPVASAQVKSCVLLAGLYADGDTTVIESVATRDHTERMLGLSTIELGTERHVTVNRSVTVAPRTWAVPGDFSAAAFFIVAGLIVPDGVVHIRGVGLNPSRTALLDVLRAMGARVIIQNERTVGGEVLADISAYPSVLHSVSVAPERIPNLIDELPVLAVAACAAEGETSIRGAEELRHKETDRLKAMHENLSALGASIIEHPDGLTIAGGKPLGGAHVKSFGDHRIAMACGVAGLIAEGATEIEDAGCASVSFPDFWNQIDRLSL